jgi:hypothetical protein
LYEVSHLTTLLRTDNSMHAQFARALLATTLKEYVVPSNIILLIQIKRTNIALFPCPSLLCVKGPHRSRHAQY